MCKKSNACPRLSLSKRKFSTAESRNLAPWDYLTNSWHRSKSVRLHIYFSEKMSARPVLNLIQKRTFTHMTWVSGPPRNRVPFAEKVSFHLCRILVQFHGFFCRLLTEPPSGWGSWPARCGSWDTSTRTRRRTRTKSKNSETICSEHSSCAFLKINTLVPWHGLAILFRVSIF